MACDPPARPSARPPEGAHRAPNSPRHLPPRPRGQRRPRPPRAGQGAEGGRGRGGHRVRKGAVLTPGTPYDERKVAHPGLEPWTPTPAELAVAERALAAVPRAGELLYARVDLVDGEDGLGGEPRIMELELVEPNLFLSLHTGSVPRVVEAILAAAAS